MIIKLPDGYGIGTYDGGYTFGKVTIAKDKKTGEEREVVSSTQYFSTIQGAMLRAYRVIARDRLAAKTGDISLLEAIEEFDRLSDELSKLLEKTHGA